MCYWSYWSLDKVLLTPCLWNLDKVVGETTPDRCGTEVKTPVVGILSSGIILDCEMVWSPVSYMAYANRGRVIGWRLAHQGRHTLTQLITYAYSFIMM